MDENNIRPSMHDNNKEIKSFGVCVGNQQKIKK